MVGAKQWKPLVPIGKDLHGGIVELDFQLFHTPHLLIAGAMCGRPRRRRDPTGLIIGTKVKDSSNFSFGMAKEMNSIGYKRILTYRVKSATR